MSRLAIAATMLLGIVSSTGCSICCTPFDYAYPAYGGKWERTDRFHGRVGSAFDPAGPIPAEDGDAIQEPTPAVPMDETAPMEVPAPLEGDMPMEKPASFE